MFRPHPASLFSRPWSFGVTAFLSTMTLWAGFAWAQSLPVAGNNARGASILVTDAGSEVPQHVAFASGCSDSCSGGFCYANDNYWQSFCRRPRRNRGGGLGICAGRCGSCVSCGGGCSDCSDCCGVLGGGCVTSQSLGCGGSNRCGGSAGGLRPRLFGVGGGSLECAQVGKACDRGDTCESGVCSSGLFAKLCSLGRQDQKCGDSCGSGCGQDGCGCGTGGDGTFCGMPAPNYPVPFRTPEYVGHYQFTYPPMMPHHSLPHYRNIYSYRHGCGTERTTVAWHPSYIMNALRQIHHVFYLPR